MAHRDRWRPSFPSDATEDELDVESEAAGVPYEGHSHSWVPTFSNKALIPNSLPPHTYQSPQTLGTRRHSIGAADLFAAVRKGSIHEVELALAAVKNIDARTAVGTTALHLAVWKNHIPILKRLLAAGADPNIRDGESGWSSLHRALHFGHVAAAGVLIEGGASLSVEDIKGRTPVDLISGPLSAAVGDTFSTEVFSWGNGANYQLGTGTVGVQTVPCRVNALQGTVVKAVAAARFHSAAVTSNGDVYTWGFGRGGRLGHADFDIHSGQVAVISPRLVAGLGGKKVRVLAAAKHHTVVATEAGEVYSWGSNREGRLGYSSVDTQPTPRRVSALKTKVTAVAASNKHTAVLTETGEVFTWGSNEKGQLGYGTSNSASSYVPKLVDYLKGKVMVAVTASKYHTMVLSSEGEVYTWGYGLVTPRRVSLTRDTKKGGTAHLKFHRKEKLQAVALAAGFIHSTVISDDGLVFYWASDDSNLKCRLLSSLSTHQAVSVSAGKYRTAVVTATGDIFVWDGDKPKTAAESMPAPLRIPGLKNAASISVGESHSVAVVKLHFPPYPAKALPSAETSAAPTAPVGGGREGEDEWEEEGEGVLMGGATMEEDAANGGVPTLWELCQAAVAKKLLEPKNAVQLMELAESVGAEELKQFCEVVVMRNLGYILTLVPQQVAQCRSHLLANFEVTLAAASVQPWSYRRLPTATAPWPPVVESEEEGEREREKGEAGEEGGKSAISSRSNSTQNLLAYGGVTGGSGGEIPSSPSWQGAEGGGRGMYLQMSLGAERGEDSAQTKQLRAVRKKLQQIELLEEKQLLGHALDAQQAAKLCSKGQLEAALALLERGVLPGGSPAGDYPTEERREREGAFGKEWRTNEKIGAVKLSKGEEREQKQKKQGKRRNVKANPSIGEGGFKIEGHAGEGGENWRVRDMVSMNEEAASITHISLPDSHSLFPMNSMTPQTPPSQSLPSQILPMQTLTPSTSSVKGGKKKTKKGGLSMFLSGALELQLASKPPEELTLYPEPPRVAKAEGPAWGGAVSKTVATAKATSLRDIQSQQNAESANRSLVHVLMAPPPANRNPPPVTPAPALAEGGSIVIAGRNPKRVHGHSSTSGNGLVGPTAGAATALTNHTAAPGGSTWQQPIGPGIGRSRSSGGLLDGTVEDSEQGGSMRVSLIDFVRSSAPIAVSGKGRGGAPSKAGSSPPPWTKTAVGGGATPSLRDIQHQQELRNAQLRHPRGVPIPPVGPVGSPLPPSHLAAAISPSPDHSGSPSSHPPQGSRWYRPDDAMAPSSLRCIQKEEAAMNDLRKLYQNVRVVVPSDR